MPGFKDSRSDYIRVSLEVNREVRRASPEPEIRNSSETSRLANRQYLSSSSSKNRPEKSMHRDTLDTVATLDTLTYKALVEPLHPEISEPAIEILKISPLIAREFAKDLPI
ncbi:uncharacterized protein N7477_003509 [Penicillium maclennaniae]|uniref:uncharacterized protein n=1 Tax=Penicillium maclennaniae TaxID=1343394 RepID=UPI0025414E5D|nr:uncharacterized protein N7477_003509 [Penicillium maclennaniae]KAJ5677876.1 hypothetical protein N7477_003509 [Penicillium maclennaniae]